MGQSDAPEAYNGRGVWSANYRKQLTFDECRRKARLMGHLCEAAGDWREVVAVTRASRWWWPPVASWKAPAPERSRALNTRRGT